MAANYAEMVQGVWDTTLLVRLKAIGKQRVGLADQTWPVPAREREIATGRRLLRVGICLPDAALDAPPRSARVAATTVNGGPLDHWHGAGLGGFDLAVLRCSRSDEKKRDQEGRRSQGLARSHLD